MRQLSSKPIFATLILWLGVLATPAHALVDVAALVGYQSFTIEDTATSKKTTFTGVPFGGFVHLTYGIPAIATLGLGGYLESSTTKNGGSEVGNLRYGGEVKASLDFVPVVLLFARLGYGAHSYSKSYDANGTSYHALVGMGYPILPMIVPFIEGGMISGDIPDSNSEGKLLGVHVHLGVLVRL